MKVLFLDRVNPYLRENLLRSGWDVADDLYSTHAELLDKLSGVDGLVIRSRVPLDKTLLDRARDLKFIARAGAGMENIDVEHATRLGVKCIHAPEGNRDAVAEHALGMLLCLMNKLNLVDREVRQGVWKREENRGHELLGRTVGVIGYGNMGMAFARRLSGFSVLTYAYDKYRKDYADEHAIGVNMDAMFNEAEVVSLHVPLATDTHHLVNDAFLARFQNPVYLINTSRGKVVDTAALIRGLESGKVLGACLDVLEYERTSFEGLDQTEMPEPMRYLINSPKVLLSPHIAGWTYESDLKIASVLHGRIMESFG